MKVLLVGPVHKFGGVTRYVKDLLASSPDFIPFNTGRPEKKKIRAGTGYVEAFNTDTSRVVKGIFVTLCNFLRFPLVLLNSGAGIVHICGVSFFPFWENTYYMAVSRILDKKVTLHYLGAFDQFYEPAGKFHKYLIRSVLQIPDRIMLLSEKVKRLSAEFIPEDRLSVLPSSVDTDKFNAPDRLFPAPPAKIRILFVGGLDPFRKGIYDLLESVSMVTEKYPHVRLVLTGGGSFEEIEKKWEKMGLDGCIEFIGWVADEKLPELYASCDVLALPSYNEGLPYVIIEALSSGLPMIGSNVGGIPEVISDGENGYIITPGDVEMLTERLLELLKDADIRKRMSANNRKRAVRFYSIDHVMKELQRNFSEIV